MNIMHQLKRTFSTALIMLFSLLFVMPGYAEIQLSQTRIVDVTPFDFSVVWYADQVSQPGIQIFEDQAGTIDITSDFEVSRYPLQGLTPDLASRYEYQQSRQAFTSAMNTQGLMQIKVHGLQPGQTYYFKLHSDSDTDSGVWPVVDTAAVTMAQENAFVIDARQLIINLNFTDAAGWPVMVSTTGAAYPVSALIEDGAAAGQAVVNIANLFAFDGVNWSSDVTETLLIEVLKGSGEIVTSNVDVNLNTLFTVASNQAVDFESPFNGSLQMLAPDMKVYTQGDLVTLSWVDDAPGVNGIISLYVDTDNQGENGSLIATAINEDDDGAGDSYSWDVSSVSDGQYYVYATLSDGSRSIASYAAGQITIDNVGLDADGDAMSDLWEQYYFETLNRDGTLDFDNDGRSDAQEYLDGTDPTVITGVTAPIIESPLPGTETDLLRPELIVQNGAHAPGTVASYTCEIYADQSLSALVEAVSNVAEGVDSTRCLLNNDLNDNTRYYWRARATVSGMNSQWVNGSFFVNTANDAPQAFNTSAPVNGSVVATLQPELEVLNALDIDGDMLSYQFSVYADAALTNLIIDSPVIAEAAGGRTSWMPGSALQEDHVYYWFATVTDEHGAQATSNVASFDVNTVIATPGLPAILSPLDNSEVATADVLLVVSNAFDEDGLGLEYLFELDVLNSFDSAALQTSGLISEGATSTSWLVPDSLVENTTYFWRALATNGTNNSAWVTASFFYNTVNDAPTVPVINNPDNLSSVETRQPTLSVNPATDPDNDSLSYEFELYADNAMSTLIEQSGSTGLNWMVSTVLADNTWFYWRARAVDEHGLASNWTALTSFFVNDSGLDDAPSITLLTPDADIVDATQAAINISWTDDDPDSNASIALYYDTDTADADGTLIVAGIEEDADGDNDHYIWDASTLPVGSYYIYAVISDATSSSIVYLPSRITIPEAQQPVWVDISDKLAISQSDPISSRRSKDATVVVRVSNPGGMLTGPFRLVLKALNPADLTVMPVSGTTDNGEPYIDLSPYVVDDLLATGESMSYIRLKIAGGAKTPFGFTVAVEKLTTDVPPVITLLAPAVDIVDADQTPVTITWTDEDPDSSAKIALYYDTDTADADGVLITSGIDEDSDGLSDSYTWDTTTLPAGTYYIYAVISDATSNYTVYLPARIIVPEVLPPAWVDITDQFSISQSEPILNRRNNSAKVVVKLINSGTESLTAPFRLVIKELAPAGEVKILRPDGLTESGLPYKNIQTVTADTIEPGASPRLVHVKVKNGAKVNFNLTVGVEQFK